MQIDINLFNYENVHENKIIIDKFNTFNKLNLMCIENNYYLSPNIMI